MEAIVEEIKHITSNPKYKNRSIGVVSLIGAKQAYEIQTRLLSELGEETYLEHKIFCGDASNFQGKEKDIMFLSMVVGAKQGTAMTKLEFEQRFNVALSRARDRMYLYRSIEETDLQPPAFHQQQYIAESTAGNASARHQEQASHYQNNFSPYL